MCSLGLGFGAFSFAAQAQPETPPSEAPPAPPAEEAPGPEHDAAVGVVITELMYNPASGEGYQPDPEEEPNRRAIPNRVEYVELYNAGDAAVNLRGWRLRDEDGSTGVIPSGPPLAPGQAVLLIPAEHTEADFRAAWSVPPAVRVVRLDSWGPDGLNNLANGPSAQNEILDLVDGQAQLVDRVNYDDAAPWPSDSPDGPSIYLVPEVLGPGADPALSNDDGASWARSSDGVHGARTAQPGGFYRPGDVGSPGVVVKPGS